MERRDFFKKAGITSAALVSLPAFAGPAPAKTGQDEHEHEQGHGPHEDLNGPLASATVSFGQWNADPVIDRFPNNSPRTQNNHHLIPGEAVIKAGGSVNFIISGFHHVLVYGDGTKPTDIDITKLRPTTVQPGPPLIDDATNRVYRGLDPSVLPALPGSTPPQPLQDRVEVVRFPNPGRYLVICGVLPHFFDVAAGFIMFGYVKVLK
jgi:hypothetical protein